MAATPRQKACNGCAGTKRRCDKQLPECQRCLDRDVDCVYPQPKRRRRDTIARETQPGDMVALQNHPDVHGFESSLDFADWGSMPAPDFDMSLSDIIMPYIPTPAPANEGLPSAEGGLAINNVTSTPSPWFLQNDTWVMAHLEEEPVCMTEIELDNYIGAVSAMLQSWVTHGHNGFIHQRLYERGMPGCVQDAFTTLAAYTNRTPAVKDTILQIADERATALARQTAPTAAGALGILAHVSRVQAMFVYVFIRLFDGSVRIRASAERQIPTLRQWVVQMREAGQRCEAADDDYLCSGQHTVMLQWPGSSSFNTDYEATSRLWKLWLLTESVRRTHVLIDGVMNTYETLTKGWAECKGVVMLTARRGLWDADSAEKWFGLSSAKAPLLVPAMQASRCISQYAADEVDDFVRQFWGFLVGRDKIQSWVDRGDGSVCVV
ncbi:hypothetical protein BDV95DRAFT_604444 [Massariosphaeria phaeospora]|uniref:Zn(2)-C6 fungal-type domain-containing protein n=1 Tax=Massariosphaeria phaeospora TaxID=100035 RepID=A0A7C8MBS2_9PLEO|nr:hypothetical protein BDV95DRAFT_604444 [Massariosphaeria phaeospora]